jgi:hypothetical protein
VIGVQLGLGALDAHFEQWPLGQAAYFAFVTWLTSGYGDLVPSRVITRLAAIVIGFIGMLLIGPVAAIGVHALQKARSDDPE